MLDYGLKFTDTPIYCDNTSAISITKNPVQHTQTKHIEIRFHFLRDNAEKGKISIHFVRSEERFSRNAETDLYFGSRMPSSA